MYLLSQLYKTGARCSATFNGVHGLLNAAVEASGGLQTRRGVDARRLEGAPQAALHEIEPRARMSVCECDYMYNRDKLARSQKCNCQVVRH